MGWKDTFQRKVITSVVELAAICKENYGVTLAVDTETTGLDFDVLEIVGFSFCFDADVAYYVPISHRFGQNIDDEEGALNILLHKCMARRIICFIILCLMQEFFVNMV